MATMADVRAIAWSLFWRSALSSAAIGFLAGFLFGFFVGIVGSLLGCQNDTAAPISTYYNTLLGITASFFCLNYFLAKTIGKELRGKRLELATIGAIFAQGER